MARRRASNKSDLGDSWVVNESDADSSSSDASDPTFEPSISLSRTGQKDPQRRSRDPEELKDAYTSKSKHQSTPTPRRRSSRNSDKPTPEPDLVMPYIFENTVGRSRHASNDLKSGRTHQLGRKRPARIETPTTSSAKRTTSEVEPDPGSGFYDQIPDAIQNFIQLVAPIFSWMFDVLVHSLHILKTPISLILAFYLLLALGQVAQNFLTHSIRNALSPLCRIPGVSLLPLPICKTEISPPETPVEFEELMNIQSQFEDILSTSANSASLPLDMKRSETTIRDLRTVVRFSTLHAKNELSLEFDGFIETARIASYDLQRFNGRVGRAVDSVLSTARWTSRVLDDIAFSKTKLGLLPAFIGNRLLAPFQPLQQSPEIRLLDQYIVHTQAISGEITQLTTEAQALLYVLQNLEDRLETIHGIAHRENFVAQGNKEDLLAHLWTMLGGNRAKLHKYNEQLRLLRKVGEYRKNAYIHISNMIVKLQAMGSELESLRERVSSAEVERDAGVQVPLRAHIESIEMGVERLEKARDAARGLESGALRKVLDAGSTVGKGSDEAIREIGR
ncbi:MAG: hypothetical protein Q9160_005133 [Pyrenula sp. 1 TL-2023]